MTDVDTSKFEGLPAGEWQVVVRDGCVVVRTSSKSRTRYGAVRYAAIGGYDRENPEHMKEAMAFAELLAAAPRLLSENARLREEVEALRKQNRQVMLTNMNYLTERDKAKEELAEARTVRPEAREAMESATDRDKWKAIWSFMGGNPDAYLPHYIESLLDEIHADLATVRRALGMEADHE